MAEAAWLNFDIVPPVMRRKVILPELTEIMDSAPAEVNRILLENSKPKRSLAWSPSKGGGNRTDESYVKVAQALAGEIVPWVDYAFRTIPARALTSITLRSGVTTQPTKSTKMGAVSEHLTSHAANAEKR